MCSDCDKSKAERKELRQNHGGGPEVPRHRKKSKGKPRKRVPGCPANGGKAHIYEWVIKPYRAINYFTKQPMIIEYKRKICVGCLKTKPGWPRYAGQPIYQNGNLPPWIF